MFSRFRNLFSKNKTDVDAGADTDIEVDMNMDPSAVTDVKATTSAENVADVLSPEPSKLEGLNLLKSLVETEHNMAKPQANGITSPLSQMQMSDVHTASFSQEVEELLQDKLSSNSSATNEMIKLSNDETPITENGNAEPENSNDNEKSPKENSNETSEDKQEICETLTTSESPQTNEANNVQDLLRKMRTEVMTLSYETKETSPLCLSKNETSQGQTTEAEQTLDQTTDQSPDLTLQTIATEQMLDQTSDQSPDQTQPTTEAEQTLDQTSNQTLEENSDESTDQSKQTTEAAKTFNQTSNLQTLGQNSDQSPDQTQQTTEAEQTLDQTSNQTLEENSEESTDQTKETTVAAKTFNQTSTQTLGQNSDQSPDQTQQTTEAEQTLDQTSTQTPDQTDSSSKQTLEPSPDQSSDKSKSPGDLMPEICKTSNVVSWVQENNAIFTPPTPYPLASTESATNLDTYSSIVVEDLPSEITTAPSPSVDSTISGSSSASASTLDSTSTRLAADPSKIVVNPIGSNGLACSAITSKLTDIAEVAESLDTVIRDIQENSQRAEVESNPSPRDKKMGTLRSTSSEDWHSRSTEDDSFVTASEGRTSSFMSCNKSSFDYSEGDDSTLAFDLPDVNSPFNMSFDESEQSFISAQQDANKTPTKLSDNSGDGALDDIEAPSSLADIEDLHSESVTPTPAENVEYYVDSIPVESETELEVAGIADAPPMHVLTECGPMPLSVTPEVSSCSNTRQMPDDASTSSANTQHSTTNSNSQNKPNVAWRRSKYYENITKQTIKGFL